MSREETFTFVGGGWGGSEGPKIVFAGLPLPTFFRKRGKVALIWGLCTLSEDYRN